MPNSGGMKAEMALGDAHPYLAPFWYLKINEPRPCVGAFGLNELHDIYVPVTCSVLLECTQGVKEAI